jgi:hypothetical protein
MKVAAVVAAALAALVVQYFVLIRPWYQTWGASAEEIEKALPGDTFWPNATKVETRAITIRASADAVWPWIAQLGQDKAGFYSYRCLENLVGCEAPAANRVLGLADPEPGEKFWMYPQRKAGGSGFATFAAVKHARYMVLVTNGFDPPGPGGDVVEAGTWSFVLEPRTNGTTRLLLRGRFGLPDRPPSAVTWLWRTFVFDPIHFGMERKMLLTLKDLAEGRAAPPAWVDVVEVVLWSLTLAFGLAALVAVFLRRATFWRPLAAGTAALFVLTLLFFARPPLVIAVVLVVFLRWVLSWAWKEPPPETATRPVT